HSVSLIPAARRGERRLMVATVLALFGLWVLFRSVLHQESIAATSAPQWLEGARPDRIEAPTPALSTALPPGRAVAAPTPGVRSAAPPASSARRTSRERASAAVRPDRLPTRWPAIAPVPAPVITGDSTTSSPARETGLQEEPPF